MQKLTECLILSERSYCVFAPQGFITKCFLILLISEELCSQQFSSSWCVTHILGAVHHWLVTYWDLCKKSGVHILKSLEVLKWQKVSIVSSFTGIVESRDKGFVLDLKFLFIIMKCFSGKFPPRFFTVKLVCFIGFSGSSYLVLFTFPLCMILMVVCFNKDYS